MKLRYALVPMLLISLACSGGDGGTAVTDEEAEKIAAELEKAAEEAAEGAADAAEDAKDAAEDAAEGAADAAEDAAEDAADAVEDAAEEVKEEVKKVKVTTTLTVSAEEKSTIKTRAKKAIVTHAKSKGYARVDGIETSQQCAAGKCMVTVTGWATP